MARRQCWCCRAETYEDEKATICQDCRGVAENIKRINRYVRPKPTPERERRILEHAARIQQEEFRLGARSKGSQ